MPPPRAREGTTRPGPRAGTGAQGAARNHLVLPREEAQLPTAARLLPTGGRGHDAAQSSANRYPTPCTVSTKRGRPGSVSIFLRLSFTWASNARLYEAVHGAR